MTTAAPERARWPRLAAVPQPPLRSLLPRGYAGFTEGPPHDTLVLPATASVPLVVKLVDSPHRPPQFLMGAHGSPLVVEGDCAPSYLDLGPRPALEVGWAWRRLVATGGAVPIRRLADEVGWSHRHLIARFRRQVGLAPKTAARLVRFDAVWRRLDGQAPVWADLAREAGYADQAHLIRDFRRFTGMTPTGYLAQVNSVQAPRAAAS